MTVKFLNEAYECIRAVQSEDSATLYLKDGGTVEFKGVSDWSVFDLHGGEWSQPEITAQEQLRADVDFLAAMTGVSL